ncbi:MAG: chemotaxis protein CheA [Oscillospiraceae bacterium]|nr:chemotaxis protein CheA [Oscillospiraceae bacterium]
MNEILASYIEDLRDSILIFNDALMSLQGGARDKETIDSIFRVAHTIKGNSAAMNFEKIQAVMHTMEDLLEDVRTGARAIGEEMVDVLFACHDFLEDCLLMVESNDSPEESDEGMDTDSLLGRLKALKGAPGVSSGTPPPAVKSNNISSGVVSDVPELPEITDVDMAMDMPADLWEILHENIRNGGYNAYKLEIKFLKNSSMKSVRAWMIFDRIEQSGIIVHSVPPRFNDSSFSSSSGERTRFDGDTITAMILCEREISDLVADLRETADIESVEARKISQEDIVRKVEFIKRQRTVVDKLQEIGVELLGVDAQHLSEINVVFMTERLKAVISANITGESGPVGIVAKRMILAFEDAINNKKRIPVSERENIIFLCHSMEECILRPESLKSEGLTSMMYRRLDDMIDIISAPELRVGEILTSGGLITSADADIIAGKQQKDGNLKFGQIAVKEKLVSALDVVTALKTDKPQESINNSGSGNIAGSAKTPPAASSAHAQGDSGSVKVPVTKVDSLIDMLSELLIYNSQLEQITSVTEVEDSKLSNILSRTEKLIKEIQSLSMSLRMIEVNQTFHRLSRIARDTAADLGKKILVNLEGADTEIDRSAIEKLFDPLMHMVRNSVSHGIEESEDDRVSVGKKPEGQVTISGYSKRGNVYIEVRDDGRGIDVKKVYEKAREKGLINENREYTNEEIYKFIFLPGFSTQENVNNVSGRGVGMNVVEDAVTKLGGKVEIDSEPGAGSSFRIKLPVNLAVVNGMIVEMENVRYIIPTMCVKKFFIARDTDWVSLQGENRAIKLEDGSIVSVISKDKTFGIADDITHGNISNITEEDFESESGSGSIPAADKEYNMVILEIDQKTLVLNVDKIIGRQDVVSKPLATDYASVPYANSASILGDGIVALILDIDAIFKMSKQT